MSNILIPLGVLAFLALFVFAFVREARKQRAGKTAVFRDFAERHGLRFEATDSGIAQRLACDLDGIGRFESPSLGTVVPVNVVSGSLNGSETVLFSHQTRFHEGDAREWFVALATAHENIVGRCSIQFLGAATSIQTIYLEDPVALEHASDPYRVAVRASSWNEIEPIFSEPVLRELAAAAEALPFRPEIQVRDHRVAAYLADRNRSPESADDLEQLLAFGNAVCGILTSARAHALRSVG